MYQEHLAEERLVEVHPTEEVIGYTRLEIKQIFVKLNIKIQNCIILIKSVCFSPIFFLNLNSISILLKLEISKTICNVNFNYEEKCFVRKTMKQQWKFKGVYLKDIHSKSNLVYLLQIIQPK